MPDVLAPAPTREAVVLRPGDLLTRTWQRWIEDLSRSLTQAQADLTALQADLTALQTQVDGLAADLLVLAADLATLQAQVDGLAADLDALEAIVAALVQPQTTTLTVAVSGAAVLTFAAMAPAGATVVGVTWRISTTFTGSLTGLAVGDSPVMDRWGVASVLTAGTTGTSAGWHGAGGFTVGSAYTVLVSPVGAGWGAAGALTCACTWLPALSAP